MMETWIALVVASAAGMIFGFMIGRDYEASRWLKAADGRGSVKVFGQSFDVRRME